jgi:hypothetical protein
VLHFFNINTSTPKWRDRQPSSARRFKISYCWTVNCYAEVKIWLPTPWYQKI